LDVDKIVLNITEIFELRMLVVFKTIFHVNTSYCKFVLLFEFQKVNRIAL